ncbi:MAG: NUDIX hydrolase [Phycisphaeraceae bacterium]|nr:NUDIX hydrolase [Phycisphaeraceae bacterium]
MTDASSRVTIWGGPSADSPFKLRFVLGVSDPRHDQAAVDRVWTRLCSEKPRLFSGPISSVIAFDSTSLTLTWRPSTYRLLAVQPEVETGTWHLSVTALLLAGARPDERVFMGRRARDVHVYPGLWEFGPSGGIDPPASSRLDETHVRAEMLREIREETGLDAADASMRTIALFRDATVRSYDIVFLVRLPDVEPAVSSDDWEYSQGAWIRLSDMPRFAAEHVGKICPPSLALASFLGWIATPGSRSG